MTQQKIKHHEVNQKMTEFEKTMQELHLLRNVSKDLKNFRKMMKIKKFD